jgi:UDP-N-acetylmuramate--alanine ligase
MMRRADLLAQLFNTAATSIAVGGTSGKSTTTGMIGWILQATGRDPTIMNGALMKNFITPDFPFAGSRVGAGDVFVTEVDESDGSIALFYARIAVVNNISLDHKSMEELRALFSAFVAKAEVAVLNLDNDETRALANTLPRDKLSTYSLKDRGATLFAHDLKPAPDGIAFTIEEGGAAATVRLQVPGVHNVSNALAALCATRAVGISLPDAATALGGFSGIKRRLELHAFPGRLLLMFQPHGFRPLQLMRQEFIACFAHNLAKDDVLVMPEPVYYGGTVTRSISSEDIAAAVRQHGREAIAFPDRKACGDKLVALAKADDRIVIMGARDDTLPEFAAELLTSGAGTGRWRETSRVRRSPPAAPIPSSRDWRSAPLRRCWLPRPAPTCGCARCRAR